MRSRLFSSLRPVGASASRGIAVALVLACALVLAGCARQSAIGYAPAYAPAPAYAAQGGVYIPATVAAPAAFEQPYALDSGDRLRIAVFGQEGMTNSYAVDVAGNVNVALIGAVRARGLTTQMLAADIAARLRAGYVREPHVTVEVETYRPFYILGEVNAPGQYPYQPNMTVETAIAIAGGYSPRADKRNAQLTRSINGQVARQSVPGGFPLRPGDTVNVPERWF